MRILTLKRKGYEETTGKVPVWVFHDDRMKEIRSDPVGKTWNYKGQLVYLAKRNDKNELVPWNPLAEKLVADSPEDLYDAIDWKLARRVYRISSDFLKKLNTGLMVGLVLILCFFMFLIFSSITGG